MTLDFYALCVCYVKEVRNQWNDYYTEIWDDRQWIINSCERIREVKQEVVPVVMKTLSKCPQHESLYFFRLCTFVNILSKLHTCKLTWTTTRFFLFHNLSSPYSYLTQTETETLIELCLIVIIHPNRFTGTLYSVNIVLLRTYYLTWHCFSLRLPMIVIDA